MLLPIGRLLAAQRQKVQLTVGVAGNKLCIGNQCHGGAMSIEGIHGQQCAMFHIPDAQRLIDTHRDGYAAVG